MDARRQTLVRTAAVVLTTAAWAVLTGLWMPRGPLDRGEAFVALVVGLAVGALAGFVLRSRWAILVAPAVFVVALELARLGVDGPTVDAPVLSEYGLYVLVVGRGFHGLVAVAPIGLGAALGAGAARRRAAQRDGRPVPNGAGTWAGRVGAGAAALVLAVLAVGLARPASTAPIVDDGGEELAGSIAELTTVEAGGRELGLMIRGHDRDAPVVLFLAGGPGGSERGAMRNHLAALEESFVVATWDQRGSGTSYDQLDPTSTVTLDGYVEDTIEVTNHLRERFDEDRIILLGQSWGTTLGVLAVQRAPELYEAYVGTGQMVSQLATDRIFYEDTLAWARDEGDDGLVERLEEIGPPPYDRMLDYETALTYEPEVYAYDHSPNSEGEGGFSENFIVDEYSLVDQVHLLGAFVDTFAALYPQLQEIDFRRTATDFEVPMYFVQGAHEAGGRAELFEEWYPMVEAPVKDLTVLGTSGHRPLFEQPEEFVEHMEGVVLAGTDPSRTGDGGA